MAGARRPAGAGSAATPPAARPRPQRAASRAKPAGAALALCAAALVAWLRRTPPTVDSLEASLVRRAARALYPFRADSRCAQAARLGPQRTGDAALAELTPWLAARGAKLAGARAAVFPGGLRGLALAADVPAGAELLSLPLDATLSAVTCTAAEHLKVALAPGATHTATKPDPLADPWRRLQTRCACWARRRSRTCTSAPWSC
jgi:hypothetical protein